MRRKTGAIGLTALCGAAALVAFVDDAHRSSSAIRVMYYNDLQAQEKSPVVHTHLTDLKVAEPGIVVEPKQSEGDFLRQIATALDEHPSCKSGDEHAVLRQKATRKVKRAYSLMIENIDLTPEEKEALYSLLIEDRIAGTHTPCKRGRTIDNEERSARIAATIGDAKLQQLLALECNSSSYWEVQNIATMLRRNDAPMSDAQRDKLLQILITTKEQYWEKPALNASGRSIDYLKHRLSQLDELQRHVMELASSELSPQQVVYLHEQYQHLSD